MPAAQRASRPLLNDHIENPARVEMRDELLARHGFRWEADTVDAPRIVEVHLIDERPPEIYRDVISDPATHLNKRRRPQAKSSAVDSGNTPHRAPLSPDRTVCISSQANWRPSSDGPETARAGR